MDPRPALTILSGAAGAFAFGRLITARLINTYPWFAAFLAGGALESLLFLLAGIPESFTYAFWWGVTTPFVLALRIAAVAEAGCLLMNSSPWLKELAGRLAIGSVMVAMAVSLVNGLDGLGFSHLSNTRLMFHLLSLGLRYSYSVLCIVCGVFWAWAALFRVGVSRNLFRHLGFLTGYFACNTAGYLIINVLRGSASWVGAFTTAASVAWYVLWGVTFTGRGERRHEGPVWQPKLGRFMFDHRA